MPNHKLIIDQLHIAIALTGVKKPLLVRQRAESEEQQITSKLNFLNRQLIRPSEYEAIEPEVLPVSFKKQ